MFLIKNQIEKYIVIGFSWKENDIFFIFEYTCLQGKIDIFHFFKMMAEFLAIYHTKIWWGLWDSYINQTLLVVRINVLRSIPSQSFLLSITLIEWNKILIW